MAEESEEEDTTLWKPKLLQSKDSTSWKRRRCCFTKVNELDARRLIDTLMEIKDMIEFDQLILGIHDEETEALFRLERVVLRQFVECFYYPSDFYNKLKPYTLSKRCQTPEDVLAALGAHGHAEVVDKFGFTMPQLIKLSELLFDGELSLRHEKRGVMSAFEATMLVCARLRLGLSKGQEMGRLFGRDPSAVSAFTRFAVKQIVDRFGYTLKFKNMRRFGHKASDWNRALNDKFIAKHGSPLRGRFAMINCFMDGFRMSICAPSVAKDIFFNGMLGSQPNILFLIVTGANGLMLGVSDAMPGCEQDAGAAYASEVQSHLADAGLFACCDAIFPHTQNIKPLPSADQTTIFDQDEKAAISHLRIAVEWCIGEVQEKFQYFRLATRQKMLHTRPPALFRAAVILQNCHRCFEGCNATSYFATERPDIESYLVPDDASDDSDPSDDSDHSDDSDTSDDDDGNNNSDD